MYGKEQKLTADRRGNARIRRRSQVYYSRAGENARPAASIDLSDHGARLVVDRSVRVGDILKIFIDFGNNVVVSGTACTVWAQALPGNLRNVAGFRLEVDAEDRPALKQSLQGE